MEHLEEQVERRDVGWWTRDVGDRGGVGQRGKCKEETGGLVTCEADKIV